MTASPHIDWPTGGFEWTDELRAKLPIIRGIRVTEPKPPTGAWAKPPRWTGEPPSHYHSTLIQTYLDSRAKRGLPPAAAPWTESEAQTQLSAEALRNPDWEYWQGLALQFFYKDCLKYGFDWVLEAALELHGPVLATRCLLDAKLEFADFLLSTNRGQLREALAFYSEDDYRAALRVAADYRGHTDLLDRIISYLFPDQAEWAEACAMRDIPAHMEYGLRGWLDRSCLSVEAAMREYCNRRPSWYEAPTAAVLLHIYRHGEAALPILEMLLDQQETVSNKLALLNLMTRLRTPGLIPAVVARFDNKQARATLDKLVKRWPAACLASALERAAVSRSDELDGWITRLALRQPDIVAPALAACSPEAQARYADLAKPHAAPEEAPAEALPEVLRNPPWTRKDRPKPLPVLELTAPPQPETMIWPEGIKERWLDPESNRDRKMTFESWFERRQRKSPEITRDMLGLEAMYIVEEARAKVYAGVPPNVEEFTSFEYYNQDGPRSLTLISPRLAQTVWDGVPDEEWCRWDVDVLRALFAQRELDALPKLFKYILARPQRWPSLVLPFRVADLAPHVAHAFKNLKQARTEATAWLRAHPETAITALIPPALGPDRKASDNARAALRWLAQNGFESELRHIAPDYGPDAASAVDALLSTDPLWIVPAKLPKPPSFFVPAAFHRPCLNSGGALPLSAVEHLGTMLAISRLDDPYAGLAPVKAACTADSLNDFSWDVLEAWLAADAPSKEGLAFTALALLGDDETARRLTPLLVEWSNHGAHARAVAGLDVLVAIGTDVAMQRLSALADNKVASESLRTKARQRLADIAAARGLSEEELADWLVPDLELDEGGTLTLDFGPRRFSVGFDEALRPCVRDESGARLKALPKPVQSDDPASARAATQRFNALKQDAKAIAKQQIERLSKAMTSRRRWTSATFRMLFMEHPVMCHLARRLVWGVYREGEWVEAFRVAEDSSLADRRDDAYELPTEGDIGLVMAAEMPEDLFREFGQLFADYEIIQPFKQLGRELYRPNQAEQKSGEVSRFVGKKVSGGSLNALANRGWRRERRSHGPAFCKPVGNGLTVILEAEALDTHSGSEWGEADHGFGKLSVRRDGSDERVSVMELTPLAFSEAMRDVDLLPKLKS